MLVTSNNKSLLIAGIFLGLGLGGFLDGIIFHQILQLHSMLSNVIPLNTVVNIEINMFWDGLFHAFTWTMTLIGIILLWSTLMNPLATKSNYLLIGAILFGFGLFNVVEGIIDHLILQIHHVVQRASFEMQFVSDISFLISGIILVGLGLWLIKKNEQIYSD